MVNIPVWRGCDECKSMLAETHKSTCSKNNSREAIATRLLVDLVQYIERTEDISEDCSCSKCIKINKIKESIREKLS